MKLIHAFAKALLVAVSIGFAILCITYLLMWINTLSAWGCCAVMVTIVTGIFTFIFYIEQ